MFINPFFCFLDMEISDLAIKEKIKANCKSCGSLGVLFSYLGTSFEIKSLPAPVLDKIGGKDAFARKHALYLCSVCDTSLTLDSLQPYS